MRLDELHIDRDWELIAKVQQISIHPVRGEMSIDRSKELALLRSEERNDSGGMKI